MEKKIVGVFRSEQEAAQAIEQLQRHGIPNEAISIIAKDQREADMIAEQTGTMAPEGVAAGAAVGAGAGGLVGGFIGLGIPEDEAKEYESYIEQGRILVLVDADQENTGIYDIFRDYDYRNEGRAGAVDLERDDTLPPRDTTLL
ncbi:general stress protein [Paenibacillus sp. p3-SID867]|uniref:general stress protein n=1 Tax=Paenibacillus sp. p3-SID867 TaxID=2916363 RepID=UPI0021A37BCE|nr:general stress protein [Paenibacillus sp. p3-SID867]MCT1398757.1 general stress protein [Paenibacillus sp. p3-SID867]